MTTRVAFFDLDSTVLSINSATPWIRRELRLGHIRWTTAVWAGATVLLYKLGLGKMEDTLLEVIASLAGQPEEPIRQRTQDFWREIAHLVRPGARAAIAHHRAQGHHVWLLTSSSTYLSEAVVAELGLDGTLCNRFEVRDGLFTGQPDGPLCFGAGKITHAAALADRLGVSLQDCVFYTDSVTDLPALEAMGEPVAVHPDVRLKRIALRRGWRVERWDTGAIRGSIPA